MLYYTNEYDKNSKDRKIHIDRGLSKTTYSNYNQEPFYKDTIKKVSILNTNICNIIKEKLGLKKLLPGIRVRYHI